MVIIFKWDDIFEIHTSDKRLLSRIYNDIYNYEQKAGNASFSNGQKIWKGISQ